MQAEHLAQRLTVEALDTERREHAELHSRKQCLGRPEAEADLQDLVRRRRLEPSRECVVHRGIIRDHLWIAFGPANGGITRGTSRSPHRRRSSSDDLGDIREPLDDSPRCSYSDAFCRTSTRCCAGLVPVSVLSRRRRRRRRRRSDLRRTAEWSVHRSVDSSSPRTLSGICDRATAGPRCAFDDTLAPTEPASGPAWRRTRRCGCGRRRRVEAVAKRIPPFKTATECAW